MKYLNETEKTTISITLVLIGYITCNILFLTFIQNPIISSIVANIFMSSLLYLYYKTHKPQKLNSKSKSFFMSHNPIIGLVFIWICVQIIANYILLQFGSSSFAEQSESISKTPIFLSLPTILIISPITEELLMRGFIQNKLTKVIPPFYAIFASSILFGLLHGNIVQMILTIPLGLYLGVVFVYKADVRYPISLHILFNLISVIVPVNILYALSSNTILPIIASIALLAILFDILKDTALFKLHTI